LHWAGLLHSSVCGLFVVGVWRKPLRGGTQRFYQTHNRFIRSSYEASAGLFRDDRTETVLLRLRGGLYVVVYIFCCTWYVVFEVTYGLLGITGPGELSLFCHPMVDLPFCWFLSGVFVLTLITSGILPLAGFLNAVIYACRFDQLLQMFHCCWYADMPCPSLLF